MSKKSLIALMTAAMQPDFSHSDLGIRYAMPTQGCWTQAHRKSGVAAAKRAAKKKASQITAFFRWLGGLVSNPATGKISHTKLWTNVAAASMTYKFSQTADAPEWLWWAYGALVGGYALIKRGIAAVPQLAEIKKSANAEEWSGND